MTDHQYRTLPAYANSDLSELFNLRMGKPARGIDEKAARFGTTFHSMILEPEKPIDWSIHHVKERALLLEMQTSFRAYLDSMFWKFPTAFFQVEKIKTWTCPLTGLPLKAKIDADPLPFFDTQPIIDLKTTSCRSSQDFFDSIIKYGYDRQAAFYLDSRSPHRYNFTFVAVQKIKPYDIFVIDMSQSFDRRKIIDTARLKNNRLLRDALAESQKANGWRPSSWSRKEITV